MDRFPPTDDEIASGPARQAEAADAELRLQDGRAWVSVVGHVDASRAGRVARLVEDLSRHSSLRRVSVDLTCAVTTDPLAAATVDRLRLGARPWVDVVALGPVGRLVPERRDPLARRQPGRGCVPERRDPLARRQPGPGCVPERRDPLARRQPGPWLRARTP